MTKQRLKVRKRNRRKIKQRMRLIITIIVLCLGITAVRALSSGFTILQAMGSNLSMITEKGDYPEELLEMLSRNPEMREFVLDYPDKKGKVYADTIGEVTKGEFPLLLQWDHRWGYGAYGNSLVAVSGCGPTALASVIAGLTGENTVTPYTIAKFAEEQGYCVEGVGTSWELFTSGIRSFGIAGTEMSLSKDTVFEALQNGQPIICSMRPGDFTTTGHFITLVGIEDGKIKVNDSNSKKNSKTLWEYETLEPQIKNLWVFQ